MQQLPELGAATARKSRAGREAPWAAAKGKLVAGRLALLLPALALLVVLNAIHALLRGFAVDVAPFPSISAEGWDRALFGAVPSEMLQSLHGTDGAWARFAYIYWASLFWVPLLLVGTIALSGGRAHVLRFLLFKAAVLLTADALYGIVPSRPPWMDLEVVRIVALQGSVDVGIDSNPYAALPSLHFAVPFLFAMWFFAAERAEGKLRLSPVLFLWSAGMAWSVVYTGEHYVADIVAAAAWVGVIFIAFQRVGLLLPRPNVEPVEGATEPVRTAWSDAKAA